MDGDAARRTKGPREPLTRRRLAARLRAWHGDAARDLLVRSAADPWHVLVVEVMSQQTQIDRVGPAWRRFVDRWPTPAALAEAGTRELLAEWAGLGYNRRALALREAARRIVTDHGGRVPAIVVALEALPGVGPYTARAIAAAAFGVAVAPLDVNVRRVTSRLTGIDPASRDLQAAADGLVDRADPRRWVNAVMDLAATTCTRAAPRCEICPVNAICTTRGPFETARPRRASPPFPATARWLRGRLVALVTEAPDGAWVALPDRLGTHDGVAVRTAARDLEGEGFLELIDGRARVREERDHVRMTEQPRTRREHWDERHAARDPIESPEADPTLVAEVVDLVPGRALDLGSGDGRNAIWLAANGWRTTAVDFSSVAIERARARAEAAGVAADWLRADLLDWTPPPDAFDLVALMFMHLPPDERRRVYARAAAAVAPGGTLLVVGHDRSNLTSGAGGPQDPDVLFTPQDVAADLPPDFRIVRAEVVRRPGGGERGPIDAVVRAERGRRGRGPASL